MALGMTLLASSRAAATPTARLTLVRGAGADRCPDEDFLRKAVATRLGYDPFFAWARKTVIIEVSRTQGGFRGRAQIVDDKGVVLGERVLESKGDDCAEPMTALGLDISIALDDLGDDLREAEPPPPSQPVEASAPTAEPAPPEQSPAVPPAVPPSPAVPVRVLVAVGSMGTLGLGPAPAVGGEASVGVSGEHWAIRSDFFFQGRSSAGVEPGVAVAAQPWGTSLLGCGRFSWPFLCAAATLTAFESEAEGSLVFPHTGRAPLLSIGIRGGVELPAAGWYFVRGQVGGDVHATRPRVSVDGRSPAYEVGLVSGELGLSIGARLF
jgi:hypothetical protein